MKKSYLPILLVAGAALAYMAFRRRGGVTVTADAPIRQTAEEFEADTRGSQVKSTILDIGTNLVSNLFAKKTAQEKTGKRIRKDVQKKLVKSGKTTKKQAKAVTEALRRPAFIRGFGDSVLV
jgi:hypothetical protein